MKHPVTLITADAGMKAVLSQLDRVVRTDTTILLIGETGTGKEIVADYIHHTSDRFHLPLVKISLAALPGELLASELFGHEKGSFTSATAEKQGLFEIAGAGTIFLDDIDDIPLDIQVKLLRVLENGEMFRVGGTRPIAIHARMIAATKVDLHEAVSNGSFRSDLFYRLNVFPVHLPPLRDRKGDVPHLVEHFLKKYATGEKPGVDTDVIEILTAYHWPGNVRELRNVVNRMVLLADGQVKRHHLPPELFLGRHADPVGIHCMNCLDTFHQNHDELIACLERQLVHYALQKTGGNKTKAAELLGLSPSTFRDKVNKYLPAGS